MASVTRLNFQTTHTELSPQESDSIHYTRTITVNEEIAPMKVIDGGVQACVYKLKHTIRFNFLITGKSISNANLDSLRQEMDERVIRSYQAVLPYNQSFGKETFIADIQTKHTKSGLGPDQKWVVTSTSCIEEGEEIQESKKQDESKTEETVYV